MSTPRHPLHTHSQSKLNRILKKAIAPEKKTDPLYNKYGVKKIEIAEEEEEEKKSASPPADVWIFSRLYTQIPMLEPQALIRGESLLAAMKKIFEKEGYDKEKNYGLEKSFLTFKAEIEKLYQYTFDHKTRSDIEKEFERQFKIVKYLVQDLINDFAYQWGYHHKKYPHLEKSDFQEFYENLFKTVETVTPRYKKSDIVAIDEKSGSVQLYERGTHDEKKGVMQYISAHKRDAAGIANFIFYSTGHIIQEGKAELTDAGFRHASFAPLDLYKHSEKQYFSSSHTKKSQKALPSVTLDPIHFKTLAITKQNMDNFCDEARNHFPVVEDSKAPPLTWINVSLLTISKHEYLTHEKQERQFDETILAADLIRTKNKGAVNPLTFTFGVNWFATSSFETLILYPDKQKFENQRAYFGMQTDFLNRLKKINLQFNTEDEKKQNFNILISSLIADFEQYSNAFKTDIEDQLKTVQDNYLKAFTKYQNYRAKKVKEDKAEPNTTDTKFRLKLRDLQYAENALNAKKAELYPEATRIFNQQAEKYRERKTELETALLNINNTAKTEPLSKKEKTLSYALEDFLEIQKLYIGNTWYKKENTFKLQTHLLDLANQQNKLDVDFNFEGQTASSYNCKSANDRAGTQAGLLDGLRAERKATADNKDFDAKEHFTSNACNLSQIYDTDGGGGKFEGGGHPNPDFAALQAETESLASHKIGQKIIENCPIPTGLILIDHLSEVVDLINYHYHLFKSIVLKDIQEEKELKRINAFFTTVEARITSLTDKTFDADHFKSGVLKDLTHLNLETHLSHCSYSIFSDALDIFLINISKLKQKDIPELKGETTSFSSMDSYNTFESKLNTVFTFRDSSYTKAVKKAYEDYCDRMRLKASQTPADAVTQFNYLMEIKKAIDNWFRYKHNTFNQSGNTIKKIQFFFNRTERNYLKRVDCMKQLLADTNQALATLRNEYGKNTETDYNTFRESKRKKISPL